MATDNTKYINYNTTSINNLQQAEDMSLNDYFLIQPQDFNTKAKILPLKNMVVTLDNCTFAKEFNEHASDIEELKTSLISGSKIIDESITNSKLADNTITSSKLVENAITNSKLAEQSIYKKHLSTEVLELFYTTPDSPDSPDNKINTFIESKIKQIYNQIAILDYNYNGKGSLKLTPGGGAKLPNAINGNNFFIKNTPLYIANLYSRIKGDNSGSTSQFTTELNNYTNNVTIPGKLFITSNTINGYMKINIDKIDFYSYDCNASVDSYDGQTAATYAFDITSDMIGSINIMFTHLSNNTLLDIQFIPFKQYKWQTNETD